ncbi:hypothetical protein PC129_g15823 [Phytophthora cactorum]|nr:hypothetical protein Pcac1_g7621 [Phytophthora cactorum]KAG2807478.1 hypothetical protein PC112_g17371 [Phytophthora cactorum]KAG2809065.1 hypothetical protein PC111_g16223 [Phytophthora cactorum]KAG2849501.1 hypothetical protein PC113_g17413 [Phytophthora cactorum]KAG2898596.1 hypothetical protein PC115_g16803 [Phytophthora cactorum]
MTRLSAMFAFVAAAGATFNYVDASCLRQHVPGRDLTTMDASESGSTEFLSDEPDAVGDRFLAEVEANIDGSSFPGGNEDSGEGGSVDRILAQDVTSSEGSTDLVDQSQDGSGLHLHVEVESSVDGPPALASLESSKEVDEESNDGVTASEDTEDDSEDGLGTPYQPGTIKPAPIDSSTSASQGFDKASLSWWK